MKVSLNKHIGDLVWLMYNDQAVCGTIKRILYRQFVSNLDYESIVTVERYVIIIKDNKYVEGIHVGDIKEVNCSKDEVYSDKESLIKSL